MVGTATARRVLLTPVLALLLLVGTAGAVSAQTSTAAPTTGGTFTGKISKTSPLTVNSNGQDRQLNLAPNATILRDGKATTANDLKVGDQVNVTSNPDNSVSRVETTTAKAASGLPGWLIPLLIALLLIGLLLALLGRRRRDNFVLERNNTNTTNTNTRP